MLKDYDYVARIFTFDFNTPMGYFNRAHSHLYSFFDLLLSKILHLGQAFGRVINLLKWPSSRPTSASDSGFLIMSKVVGYLPLEFGAPGLAQLQKLLTTGECMVSSKYEVDHTRPIVSLLLSNSS